MDILVIGLSYKTTPIEMRERLAFQPAMMAQALQQLKALPSVAEGMIVSTCNRVELILCSSESLPAQQQCIDFMASFQGVDVATLTPYLYRYHGRKAVRHLFRVAASLESMVLGEPQILGQIKAAYKEAVESKSVGLILNRLLHKTFSVAKRVRTETEIAANAVSVSFAAVELAHKIFADFSRKKVLLLGAGEMCELAARHFLSHGIQEVMVTNRTYAHAQKLAKDFGGTPIRFEAFHHYLPQADIVLSSTGASEAVLTHKQLDQAIKERKHRPMLLIDIAVPRDIEPSVANLDGAYLYDVDDLQGVVQANLKERQKEVAEAEEIIAHEVEQYRGWLASLEVVPTIKSLRERFDQVRQAEVDKVLATLPEAAEAERNALETLSVSMMNKLLHQPMTVLKRNEHQSDGAKYADAVRALFDLAPVEGQENDEN